MISKRKNQQWKISVLIISWGMWLDSFSVFAFQGESVLLLSFHGHSNGNGDWVDDWFDDFRADHMAGFNFGWFWDYIFTSWWLSPVSDILTVLSFSLGNLIFIISVMISHNILGNLNSSLFSSSLTLFCMLCKLLYRDKFLTNCAWLSSTSTSFFVFLNFYKSISILAINTVNWFPGTSLRMRLKKIRRKHLLAHFALLLRMLFSLS